MANKKESLIFIINVDVLSKDSQDNSSVFEKVKTVILRIIEKKIFLRPKDEIGVILTGTNSTHGKVQFKNIQTINMQVPNWKLIRTVSNLKHTNCLSTWIEALHYAIEYIAHECCDNSAKTVVLFSDFKEVTNMQKYNIDNIIQILQKQRIRLVPIGSESLHEKSQSSNLKDICKKVNATYKTIDEALDDFRFITKSQSKFIAAYFILEIFDLQIPVKSYVKVKTETRLPSWKLATDTNSQSETIQPKDPAKVEQVKEHLDRHREIHKSDKIVHGYIYGGVFTGFTDEDQKAMLYKSGPKSYKFLSTARKDDVDIRYWCSSSSTHIILPDNETVAPQFYSLLQAMNDKNIVAIVRKVSRKDSAPNIVALFPHINIPDEPWCFVEIKLPFAEDTRVMDSKPLTSYVKQLSNEQNKTIDNFLDLFVSTEINTSEKRKQKEFIPGCIPNPMKQNTYNVLSYRALNPEKPLPPVDIKIKQLLEPCKSIIEKLEAPINEIKNLFDFDDNSTCEIIYMSKNPENVASKGQSDIQKNYNSSMDYESSEEPVLSLDISDIDMDQLMANI